MERSEIHLRIVLIADSMPQLRRAADVGERPAQWRRER
jgi:hypothetical protein